VHATAVGAAALSVPAAAAAPAASSQARSPAQDVEILNFALLLEHLQAAFYAAALRRGFVRGELRAFAETVLGNEEEHVALIRQVLGPRARPRPTFSFDPILRDRARFVRSALTLEDAGVAAYNGQAANLTRRALLPALRIVSVEGRHAAWIRDIAGAHPAPFAADRGLPAPAVVSRLRKAGLLRTR
jgi:Ferritin-like domain